MDLFGKQEWKDVSECHCSDKRVIFSQDPCASLLSFIVGYSERGHVVVAVVVVYVRAWILDNCRHDVDEDR